LRLKLKLQGICIMVCALIVLSGVLLGTVEYMNILPVHNHFKCALCHKSSDPASEPELNEFGVDFKSNGYQWNGSLAVKDSDNDGYANGLELGDLDGDGDPDFNVERSNPGDPDNYPSSIERETWSVIRSLFAD
jgi:hypothetical protein